MYIDFHTHQSPELVGTWTRFHDFYSLKLIDEIYLSRGLHPWGLSLEHEKNEVAFEELLIAFKTHSFMAVGETGFDRYFRKDLSLESQEEIFYWHYDLAVTLKLPMILHIVHAHDYFLKVLKKIGTPKTSLVIHDFRSSRTDLQKYLKYPIFFSFGKSLLGSTSKTPELLQLIPDDRFFLETDGELGLGINQVYKKASLIKELEIEELEKKLEKNFISLFPNYNFSK